MAAPLSVYMFTDTPGASGAERALLTLIEGLDRNLWRPTLVHHPGERIGPLLADARSLGVELWEVPPMPEGLTGAARVPRLIAALRSRRPAVFHAHLIRPTSCKFGLFAATLAGVPAVIATAQLFVEPRLTRSAYLQQRLLGARVGRYIAVSRYVRDRLLDTFGWSASKVTVIPNGVDPRRVRSGPDASLRAVLSRDGARPVVLAMTRLHPEKGLAFLLEAARELPGVQIVIAGEGPQRAELVSLSRRLGVDDRVDFLGRRDDVPQLLASSDVVVLPSLNEGLPLAVLEAMAAQRAIVATNIGGTNEAIVDGETGLLVPPRDSGALVHAIRQLLDDRPLAAALASAAADRVNEDFSSARMVERVTGIYGELLGSPRAPSWSPA